jgi:hypothetical protein
MMTLRLNPHRLPVRPISPLALAAAMLLCAISTPPASAQATGNISGTVTNATTNQPVAGATVTLSQFASQSAESVDTTTTTDQQGQYAFPAVDTSDGFVYATSVTYAGALYSSGMLRFEGVDALTGNIIVFEGTTDPSIVRLTARAVILAGVDPEQRSVTVTDLYVFAVTGDRAFVAGEDGRTLRFSVPPSAIEVSPRPGFNFGNVSIEGNTVYATSALRPGEANASLDYVIPYAERLVELPLTAEYPTSVLRVLLPVDGDGDLRATADGVTLLDEGIIPIEGQQYHMWTTEALQPGQPMTLTFTGLPRAAGGREQLRTLEPALLAFVVLALASAVTGWLVVKRGLHRPRPVVVAPAVAVSLDTRRGELTDELRRLEAAWQAGSMEEPAYRTDRRAILEELRAISRRYRGLGDDE